MQKKSPNAPAPVHTKVRKVRIDAEQAGQRIDNFLRRELPGVPKGRLYRILRRGEVRVNGGRVRAEYKLQEGDEVRVPPARVRAPGDAPQPALAARIAERVMFEDKRLLVIDKPSGVAVHGGSGISHGVIELLRHARPELTDLSLVHRLDRETSGCLVLAKRRSALRELHDRFREGVVEKNYLALVVGDWQHGEQLIDKPLLVQNRQGRRASCHREQGRQARPDACQPVADLRQVQPVAVLAADGRTHQIRVHLQALEYPILGDERYGDEDENRRAKKFGLKRLFLHAQSIAFPDDSGNEQHFTAPLSDDLERFLAVGVPKLQDSR